MPGLDDFVELLLHGDGDGQTIVDSSLSPKSVTVVGNTTQSATQSKFGGKSIYFDGAGDYLSLADSEDFYFGSGDFTIDFWMYCPNTALGSVQSLIAKWGTGSNIDWILDLNSDGTLFVSLATNGGSGIFGNITSISVIPNNTWVHIEYVRSGANFYLFIDGVLDGMATPSTAVHNNSSELVTIGNRGSYYYTGYIEELRISKGIARNTENFTPPTEAYSLIVPTTVAPTTLVPTTLAPTTIAPTTTAPTTLAPTTIAPTTLVPTTLAPTTLTSTTLAPTTVAPTTVAPTTLTPTTLAPTTISPTTLAPTTLAPTTLAPTTPVPTTISPTTIAPTTLAPTTLAPTTLVPTTPVPTAANDFTLDPNCKALWRFESGALIVDSIGTNTLTNLGSIGVAEDLINFKEGACAANFERGEWDRFEIADADLDAGFPLKNGDSTKKASFAFWIKPESFYVVSSFILKKVGCFEFDMYGDSGTLKLNWFYSGGNSLYDTTKTLIAGQWYHIGVVIDGVNKTLKIRVFDETAGTTTSYNFNPANELLVGSGTFKISEDGYPYDGIIDESVVFDDLLSDSEIDQIRQGIYGSEYTTTVPTTLAPTTTAPTTTAPTTLAPTTVVPTTVAPTTLATTTATPTTVAPTTVALTTTSPTSLAPTTPVSTTVSPTTLAPTTQEPTTLAPTTLAPTTIAPTTLAPTTLAPTTIGPTTVPPTTLTPTTLAPTTVGPTTLPPTSLAPTSLAPTTTAPTTAGPTTTGPTTLAPTTLTPTTVSPTTIAPTVGPTTTPPTTIPPTTLVPTTAPPSTIIYADTLEFAFGVDFEKVNYAPPWDPSKDTIFDCNYSGGGDPLGRLSFDFSLAGECIDEHISADTLEFAFELDADVVEGLVHIGTHLTFNYGFQLHGADDSSAYVYVGVSKGSYVQWSKIGSLNFTIDHSNEAGKAYLRDIGNIYGARKLGNSVVVYGDKGVGLMTPSEIAWGFKLLSNIGIISRDAHIGNDKIQWYIDINGDLNEVTGQVQRIGYKEFLSTLTNPIMLMDERRFLLYICDGEKGFVYSYNDKSLCEGPANTTGFGYSGSSGLSCISYTGPLTTLAPTTTITTQVPTTLVPTTAPPKVLIKTDIFDFGTRKEKTIYSLQLSTDLDVDIQAAIEYRLTKDGDFASTPWVTLTPHGVAYLPCYGIEFRIKFKTTEYASFGLDQLRITGLIHGVDKTEYIGGFYD